MEVEPVGQFGRRAPCRSHYTGRIKGTEAPLGANYFSVYEYEDDLFTSMRDYEREEEVREAIATWRRHLGRWPKTLGKDEGKR
jgi:hypothetical protein